MTLMRVLSKILLFRKRWVYQNDIHMLVYNRTTLTLTTNHFTVCFWIKCKLHECELSTQKSKSTHSVSTMSQAGEASVGWALGYILSVSSLLPEEPAGIRKGLCPAAWTGLLILLTILLTATFCYMALLVIRRKRSNEGVS